MSGFTTTTLRANAPHTFFATPFDGKFTPEPFHPANYHLANSRAYSPLHRRKYSGTKYDVRSTYRADHPLRAPSYRISKLNTATTTTTTWSPPSSITFGTSFDTSTSTTTLSPPTPPSSSPLSSTEFYYPSDEERCFIPLEDLEEIRDHPPYSLQDDIRFKCAVELFLVLLVYRPRLVLSVIGICLCCMWWVVSWSVRLLVWSYQHPGWVCLLALGVRGMVSDKKEDDMDRDGFASRDGAGVV